MNKVFMIVLKPFKKDFELDFCDGLEDKTIVVGEEKELTWFASISLGIAVYFL